MCKSVDILALLFGVLQLILSKLQKEFGGTINIGILIIVVIIKDTMSVCRVRFFFW